MNSKGIQFSLLALGGVMLLFALWNWLVPRAHYLSSNPQPGAMLTTTPSEVAINFSEELAPESTASVASTITLSAEGERYSDGKRFVAAGPKAQDPDRQSLHVRLDPALPKGLYWVEWNAVAARGKSQRSGRFCFGVGMSVPDHIIRDMPGAIYERDYRYRDHRAVLLSGFLLIGLGLLLPRLSVSK